MSDLSPEQIAQRKFANRLKQEGIQRVMFKVPADIVEKIDQEVALNGYRGRDVVVNRILQEAFRDLNTEGSTKQ